MQSSFGFIVTISALLLGISTMCSQTAAAWSLEDLVCDYDKYSGTPVTATYWAAYYAVVAAKDAGKIRTKDECQALGDAINDVMIPTGAIKNCICNAISWPTPPPPPPFLPEQPHITRHNIP